MYLDTKEDQEEIRKLMIKLYVKHYEKAKKYDLWFHHKRDQLWFSPDKMKQVIENGECKRINFDEWQYVSSRHYIEHAKRRIAHWAKERDEAAIEVSKANGNDAVEYL